ncbi:hypothetical protein wTpre_776A, partial [Wolbachia endosymbiont of Trichogramma pretiosum]
MRDTGIQPFYQQKLSINFRAQKNSGFQLDLLHRSNKKNCQLLTKFTVRQAFNLLK